MGIAADVNGDSVLMAVDVGDGGSLSQLEGELLPAFDVGAGLLQQVHFFGKHSPRLIEPEDGTPGEEAGDVEGLRIVLHPGPEESASEEQAEFCDQFA